MRALAHTHTDTHTHFNIILEVKVSPVLLFKFIDKETKTYEGTGNKNMQVN